MKKTIEVILHTCDRCGKNIEKDNIIFMSYGEKCSIAQMVKIDLCDECFEEYNSILNNFISLEKRNEIHNSIEKPTPNIKELYKDNFDANHEEGGVYGNQ
jgi:hypothetical protein